MTADLATVSFRTESGAAEGEPWLAVNSAVLSNTVPWRTFRSYKGQRHYSGMYWSATMHDHVVYESRLELSRLIFADFDHAVRRILAQPFLLKMKVDGKTRKHIPDYFLVTDQGPVVVDVKPEHLLAKSSTVAHTFAWTRRLVEVRGWQYEVWSGAQPYDWRIFGSSRATGASGCSTRSCLTRYVAWTWRVARSGMWSVAWRAMILRQQGPRFCTCSGAVS
jgi:hypothetical protein